MACSMRGTIVKIETKTIASGNIESMNGTEFAVELGDVDLAGGLESVRPLSVCPGMPASR